MNTTISRNIFTQNDSNVEHYKQSLSVNQK